MKTQPGLRNKNEPDLPPEWGFRLYIAGETPRSLAAFANLKRVCESNLKGNYEIEVIDLQLHPARAKGDQILAIPSLIRLMPPPTKKIIGDLANEQRLLMGLEITVRNSSTN